MCFLRFNSGTVDCFELLVFPVEVSELVDELLGAAFERLLESNCGTELLVELNAGFSGRCAMVKSATRSSKGTFVEDASAETDLAAPIRGGWLGAAEAEAERGLLAKIWCIMYTSEGCCWPEVGLPARVTERVAAEAVAMWNGCVKCSDFKSRDLPIGWVLASIDESEAQTPPETASPLLPTTAEEEDEEDLWRDLREAMSPRSRLIAVPVHLARARRARLAQAPVAYAPRTHPVPLWTVKSDALAQGPFLLHRPYPSTRISSHHKPLFDNLFMRAHPTARPARTRAVARVRVRRRKPVLKCRRC